MNIGPVAIASTAAGGTAPAIEHQPVGHPIEIRQWPIDRCIHRLCLEPQFVKNILDTFLAAAKSEEPSELRPMCHERGNENAFNRIAVRVRHCSKYSPS